ncbi:RagB/SusD family nutrient uptake outer membrane protein [Flavisolibacter tropicus]|uniref:Carbohydrate-binding protein SusD n=1 Tax=Flavisolibacter tropicus TaxID=1492898 RepID=A0A172U1J4_9BACT|nr:RagB/SusD family nutrient uptake outer membrane protein [Flavisolibacter tropicus]ANE53180.1 hypothetical protein SY85_24645 [Flavisolibacter tropicus]
MGSRINKIGICIGLSGMLALSSCSKFLETEPDNRTTVTTPQQVSQLVANAYPKASYIAFCEAMSDNAEDKDAPFSSQLNSQSYNFQDVETIDYDTPESYWTAAYKAISQANQALQVIEKSADKANLKAQKGEALVARAYAHFMLVNLFSKVYDANAGNNPGIPYVTAPENVVNGQYERKTVKYVYEMIEKDLTEGMPLINDGMYANAPKFHFNTAAVHAFAARFYLFKKEYDKVLAHCKAAVSGDFAPSLRPWNGSYSSLQYAELQAIYSSASENANIMLQEAMSVWGRSYPTNRFGMGETIVSTLMYTPQNPTGGRFAIGRNIYGTSPQTYNIPKFREHFVYASATANYGDPYNTIPLFTVEEVLFNKVEANCNLGNYEDAVKDLNAWVSKNIENYDANKHNLTVQRIKNYYPTLSTADAIIKTALEFKRATFMHEGMRWFDNIRLKMTIKHALKKEGKVITIGPDDNRRAIQIPTTATLSGIALNPR